MRKVEFYNHQDENDGMQVLSVKMYVNGILTKIIEIPEEYQYCVNGILTKIIEIPEEYQYCVDARKYLKMVAFA